MHALDRIYLTGSTARALRRLVRCAEVPGLGLVPDPTQTIEPLTCRNVTAASLGLTGLRQLLSLAPNQPLEISVGAPKQRIRAQGLRCHVRSSPLPSGSFERLVGTDVQGSLILPTDIEVLLESPCLSFLSAAARLSALVREGRMTPQEAELRLFKLEVEAWST